MMDWRFCPVCRIGICYPSVRGFAYTYYKCLNCGNETKIDDYNERPLK